MITKDRESIRRRLRVPADLYFQLDPRWIGRALLIDGIPPRGEEGVVVGGGKREVGGGGIGEGPAGHGNYF